MKRLNLTMFPQWGILGKRQETRRWIFRRYKMIWGTKSWRKMWRTPKIRWFRITMGYYFGTCLAEPFFYPEYHTTWHWRGVWFAGAIYAFTKNKHLWWSERRWPRPRPITKVFRRIIWRKFFRAGAGFSILYGIVQYLLPHPKYRGNLHPEDHVMLRGRHAAAREHSYGPPKPFENAELYEFRTLDDENEKPVDVYLDEPPKP